MDIAKLSSACKHGSGQVRILDVHGMCINMQLQVGLVQAAQITGRFGNSIEIVADVARDRLDDQLNIQFAGIGCEIEQSAGVIRFIFSPTRWVRNIGPHRADDDQAGLFDR